MNSNWIYTGVFTILPLAGLAWGGAKPKATSAQATNSRNAPATLSAAAPASVGFDQSLLAQLNNAMHRMVDKGEVAGAMTMLARHGKIVNYDAYGKDNIAINSSREKVLRSPGSSSLTMLSMRSRLVMMMAEIFSSSVPSVTSLKT